MKIAVLVVSPHFETARTLADALEPLDVAIQHVPTVGQANRQVHQSDYQIVLTEAELADGTWRDLLSLCRGLSDNPSVVVASIHADARLWVDAVDAGAADVLRLPFERPEVRRVLGTALEHHATGATA